MGFVIEFFGLMVQTIFAITIHRIILLGSKSVEDRDIFKWSKRETSFTLYAVVMGLAAGAVSFVFVFMGPPGIVIAIILILSIFSRWSLVFPGTAVDKEVSFALSWKLTSNHQLLMFLIVLIFPILLNLPTFLLEKLPATIVMTSFLSTLSIIFTVAALSVAYRYICKENDPHVIEG